MTVTSDTKNSAVAQSVLPIAIESDRLVLTVAEAGALLGISRAFAYELVARGELPVVRLGRRRLVPRRALLAMLDPEPLPAESAPLAFSPQS